MTAEQKLFLHLLADHAQGTVSAQLPASPDWDALYEIADKQAISGVIYAQLKAMADCGASVPVEVLRRFHEAFYSDVYYAANREAILHDVLQAHTSSGVRAIPFKGWLLKDYWPAPELRQMGDIDLIISPEDRQKSDDVMMVLGYHRMVDNHAVWTYYERDLEFEIHDHMFYEQLSNHVDYIGYFDNVWDYVDPDLDEGFHLLYTFAHMAKHITNKGIGFRAFLDLVFMCRCSESRIDWLWLQNELKKLQLYDFAVTCISLCNQWFGVTLPIPTPPVDSAFYEFTTAKVFSDGIFGLQNVQNCASNAAKEIKRTSAPYWYGALKLTVKNLFPAYRDMQLISWYHFVDGRPWLLPAAWVYRWGYCLTHKRENSLAMLREPFEKRKTIEKRQKLIRDWGL